MPPLRTQRAAARPVSRSPNAPPRSDRRAATTRPPQTVADIEAIRAGGRLRKARAVRHLLRHEGRRALRPDLPEPRVERSCSTRSCPPTAPNRSNLPTFAAIPRVLRQLCAARACAHITPEPGRRPAKLVRRLGAGALQRSLDRRLRASPTRCGSPPNDLLGDPARRRPRTDPAQRIPRRGALGRERRRRPVRAPAARRLAARRRRRRRKPERELRHARCTSPPAAKRSCSRWNRAASPRKRLAEATAQIKALASEPDRAVRTGERARHQRHAGVRVLAVYDARTRAGTTNRSRACPR